MRRTVLAWDAPNIDMTLFQLLGRRPGQADRPDMRAVLRWMASKRERGDRLEAAVFVNVSAERPQALQGWVTFLQNIGFRVFARPKMDGSDIDEAMVEYIRDVASDASNLVVASNDAHRFLEPIREIASTVRVTVLGFAELAGELAEPNGWEFVDLEEVPDVIRVSLNRTRLDMLPEAGKWFEPRVSVEQALGAPPGTAQTSDAPARGGWA
jgi:putative heme uptake system protein